MTDSTASARGGAVSSLISITEGSRLLFAVSFVMMVLGMASSFLMPQVVRFALDCVIDDVDPATMAWGPELYAAIASLSIGGKLAACAAFAVGSAMLSATCTRLHRVLMSHASEGAICRLRDRLFSHILRLPLVWHLSNRTGDIIQRCTADVEVVRGLLRRQLAEVVRTIVTVIYAYSIMFGMNVSMASVSFVFIPILLVYSSLYLKRISEGYLAADEAEGELLSIAQENFTGVRVVRAFGREREDSARFAAQNEHYSGLWIGLGNMLSTYWASGDFFTGIQLAAICAMGAYQASIGSLTVGAFFVFADYSAMLIHPVRALGRVLADIGKAGVSIERIAQILRAEPETDPDDALTPPMDGEIVFSDVDFSYGDRHALRGVSFAVPGGGTLGVLGATGSGKSTIAALLSRLYDLEPGHGSITVGGTDLASISRAHVRKNVGLVMQEPFLYSDTIRANIASLDDSVPMDEIVRASRIAQADETVRRFPDGYETTVGERGVTLSGGQKQRAAIARAIVGSPPILVFDDSLSAVDTRTDAAIRAALAAETRGATKIVISHRAASLSTSDMVIVMEDGRIVESGTPDELERAGGVYARTLEAQRGGRA